MEGVQTRGEQGAGFSRRNFLKGVGLAGAVVAGSSLMGCAPKDGGSDAASKAGEVSDVAQRLIDRGILGANLPDAAPILPVDPPDAWDDEADVVVVGLGGGGLVASGYLAEKGFKVIGIDKQTTVGGATRHACDLACLIGGTKPQKEAGFPGFFNGDTKAAIRYCQQASAFTSDEDFITTLAEDGVEGFDWVLEQEGVPLVCLGIGFHEADVVAGKRNHVLGLNDTINALEAVAQKNGADLRLNTPCKAFVKEGDRIVGGQIGKTLCGLRVNSELQVCDEAGKAIPGLYANMMTAGGACGESSYCGNMVNTSVLGGVVASFATGYLAAKTAIADNV